MTTLRAAAIVTWGYAAGFGLSAIPVAIYLQQRGRLPSFFGLFDMYGGPWSARLLDDAFVLRLIAFLTLTLVVAWAAWLVWNGSKAGAILALALLPIEAVSGSASRFRSLGSSAPLASSSCSLAGRLCPAASPDVASLASA